MTLDSCDTAETDVMDVSLPEHILLDENAEAAKHSFYMVSGKHSFRMSSRHRCQHQDTAGWASQQHDHARVLVNITKHAFMGVQGT